MTIAAAAGDTWGFSGPTFFAVYMVIAVAVGLAGIRARRAIADPRPRPVLDLTAHPYDVAYLNGGPELAVYSALSSMHLAGTIAVEGRGSVRATARASTDALERAIHFAAAGPIPRHRLQSQRPVTTALDTISNRLVDAGLLLSAEQRRAYRAVGWWMLAVAGLGLVSLLAGIAEAKPVWYLSVALCAVTVVGVVQLTRAPRRSRSGDTELARLRREHGSLAPENEPDWAAYGPAGAALGVGIFGMSALWISDPAFADEIGAKRVAAGGGGSGWSGSSDSGSSDSGGGSDGGGGGGCGGGGCGGCGGGGG